MRFAASAVVLGSVASMAAAVASPPLDFYPDVVPMNKRHTSGPGYECHASCGYAIKNSKVANEGYCKDASWTKLLHDCLDCALKYEIWDYYRRGVRVAAERCDLDATPKPVDGGASSKAELATAAASTTSVVTSAAPSQTSASAISTTISTAVEQTTSVSSHHHVPAPHASAATGAWMVTSAPTTAAGELNSTAPGAVIVTAGASKNILSGLAVAGLAALAAAGLF
ncbi:hypothetical protein C2857_004178 [Epichloe festucae Fl1]|uniref:Uncharacterized protein n=1 Tax=Epichloe festucae (strain Fl1) TaxID=877507 RepID=A0A7S9KP24_EPIFF|nr:hypothetical protein C2857_004178 [Epichloe festucae Fl1]